MKTDPLFSYTPRMMSANTLETIFVRRHKLVDRVVEQLRDSALTDAKHHILLAGPRGIGKSHLVAMVYHRLRSNPEIEERLRIAWLSEDEGGIDTFLTLLIRIFRALESEYPVTSMTKQVSELYGLPEQQAARQAEQILIEYMGERTLLIIVENLDDLFKGLGEKGQRQLRGFIQSSGHVVLLATSSTMRTGTAKPESPFYGFFNLPVLEELKVDDAVELLKKIANYKHDTDLENFLGTPEGRLRVRAVDHLACGNPRLYVIFSEFLSRNSLDELVEPFLSTLNDLTPYYQSRLTVLPAQQRKIVDYLCDRASPATVKEIAQRCFITPQTAAGQLRDLLQAGYVRDNPLGPTGRETYYEIKEPLLRLTMELKKSRGGPVQFLVEFLRLWYPLSELKSQLNKCSPDMTAEREYLSKAIELATSHPHPFEKSVIDDLVQHLVHNDWPKALVVARQLDAIRSNNEHALFYLGVCLIATGEFEEALRTIDSGLKLNPKNERMWEIKGQSLTKLGNYRKAAAAFKKARRLSKSPRLLIALAMSYIEMDEQDKALDFAYQAVHYPELTCNELVLLAKCYSRLQQFEDAVAACDRALLLEPRMAEAHYGRGLCLENLNDEDEALAAFEMANTYDEGEGKYCYAAAKLYLTKGNFEKAASLFDKTVCLNAVMPCAAFGLSFCQLRTNQATKAISSLRNALTSDVEDKEHPYIHTIELVETIFHVGLGESSIWAQLLSLIIEEYTNAGKIQELAPTAGVTSSLLLDPKISLSLAEEWLAAWRIGANDQVEFEMPLKMMDVAIRYYHSHDKRVALELSSEQRSLLLALFEDIPGFNDLEQPV